MCVCVTRFNHGILETKIAISGWLMNSCVAQPKRKKKTGCAAALGTKFVWKEIKIKMKKLFWYLVFKMHAIWFSSSLSGNNGFQNTNKPRKKNRRDLGFACQMRNYLAQKKGGEGEGGEMVS